jgi:urease accessory protein
MTKLRTFCAASLAAIVVATRAEAHHAMGGELPSTLVEGFVSGVAHPVIGLDHLAFIVAAGVIAGVAGLGFAVPLAFVVASILGVAVHLMEWNIPAVELLIAVSVVSIGAFLAARGSAARVPAALVFALVGLFHGYAYGESIVGAEQTPLAAYLFGLTLVQGAIVLGATLLASRSWSPATLAPRLVGAAVFGVGLTAVVGQLVPG